MVLNFPWNNALEKTTLASSVKTYSESHVCDGDLMGMVTVMVPMIVKGDGDGGGGGDGMGMGMGMGMGD